VAEPMFRLQLFRIRAFTAGTLASFLSAVGRGGLMFMLIIWLQGIWLPLHGYDFARTPLWAGIYMLPLTAGFIIAGPISGILSDRYGARPFATAGMLLTTISFVLLELLPVDFGYWEFAPLLLMMGLSNGLFMSPNRAAVMSSLPAEHRGAGSGMTSTFQNSAQVFSIGIFFTLMIVGLSAVLPASMYAGLVHQGVSHQVATRVAHLPPVSTLFAAFLGYNPMQHLLGASVLAHLPAGRAAIIQGRSFFPNLISSPFEHGLHTAFDFAIGACLAAAAASWFRGERHADDQATNTAKGLSATDPSAPLERPVS
jgi:MFS family permease